jgi:hypothetical protein
MSTVKIVVQGPLEEIQRILPRLEGETVEVQINNNGSSLLASQPIITNAPIKKRGGAASFWAGLTKEERSKEMARRQKVALKNKRKNPMGGVA